MKKNEDFQSELCYDFSNLDCVCNAGDSYLTEIVVFPQDLTTNLLNDRPHIQIQKCLVLSS